MRDSTRDHWLINISKKALQMRAIVRLAIIFLAAVATAKTQTTLIDFSSARTGPLVGDSYLQKGVILKSPNGELNISVAEGPLTAPVASLCAPVEYEIRPYGLRPSKHKKCANLSIYFVTPNQPQAQMFVGNVKLQMVFVGGVKITIHDSKGTSIFRSNPLAVDLGYVLIDTQVSQIDLEPSDKNCQSCGFRISRISFFHCPRDRAEQAIPKGTTTLYPTDAYIKRFRLAEDGIELLLTPTGLIESKTPEGALGLARMVIDKYIGTERAVCLNLVTSKLADVILEHSLLYTAGAVDLSGEIRTHANPVNATWVKIR